MGTVTMPSPSHHQSQTLCSPFLGKSNFPDTFQDFFAKLSEVDDSDETILSLLEDKQLLPPKSGEPPRRKLPDRHWSMNRKSLRRRGEMQSRGSGRSEGRTPQQLSLHPPSSSGSVMVSPMVSRRRSSSIAVTRTPPDLHRFLQAEQQRSWHHGGTRSPSPSPTPGLPSSKSVSPRPPRHSPVPPGPENGTYNRSRTSSMPVVPTRNRPMLAQTKRNDDGMEYYRLRSFSITPNGIFNLGDSFKSRRSRSISSVNSTESSQTDVSIYNRDRLPSTTSQGSTVAVEEPTGVPTYRVAMLGASGVGKTALTYQFTTSEYICAYDTSLDDEFGQKTVSVMLDGRETELEIVDHPASEISVETFCSTYNPDVYVVVYSVVDRKSMKIAEEMLMYLWNSDYMATRGVILVGNKADLERKREVPMAVGRKVANSCGCKFIETSSGLDHNVDELLVGILAQVQLNPRRDRKMITKKKKSMTSGRKLLKHLLGIKRKSKSCENLLIL